MLPRALVLVLGLVTALFAWWASWELAMHLAEAPQAIIGVLGFALVGLVAAVAAVRGAATVRG